MDQLDLYVYECTNCSHTEVLSSESVAPPEVHLFDYETVYCTSCGNDTEMEFLGLEGFQGIEEDDFVLDGDTEERYCPLCKSACRKK